MSIEKARFIAALNEISQTQNKAVIAYARQIDWNVDHDALASRQTSLNDLAHVFMHAAADALEVIAKAGSDSDVSIDRLLIVETLEDHWTNDIHEAWEGQREKAREVRSPMGRAEDAADRAHQEAMERF